MEKGRVEVVIANTGERRQIEQGATLAQLASQLPGITRYDVLGALVNNEVTRLQYRVYNPKVVRFFDITDKQGWRMYVASLAFMLYKAVRDCYPTARLELVHSLANGYYCRISGSDELGQEPNSIAVAQRVRDRMIELQRANLPFENENMLLTDALELLADQNVPETHRLMQTYSRLYINMQFLGGTPHKISTILVPSTGCLATWDLRMYEEGYLLCFPDPHAPDKLALFRETPKLYQVYQEYHKWVELLHVPTIADLNRIVRDKGENHLIHLAEALHEKKYGDIADAISQRRGTVRMVLLAGPSSSGKTTSCRRLAVQLAVLGFDVQQLSLDDYFVARDRTPLQPNGEHDFEALEALDIPLLNDHLLRLFRGEEVKVPTYDFIKGTPYYSGRTLRMGADSILLVEGIHALNPRLTQQIADELKYKVYVSTMTQIAIDDQNIIHTSDSRLIRRIVRDHNFRGYSALNTLRRWDSVQAGEQLHIFPYQENADIMFNSALLYELGVLKVYAEPELKRVPENVEEYAEAQRLLKFINLLEPIDPKFIPPTSIMREFLGGSSFEY